MRRLWPDLVVIDGGPGQTAAATRDDGRAGVADVRCFPRPRGAEREAATRPSTCRRASRSGCRRATPVLYFVERRAEEAHRFAIGRTGSGRKRDIREAAAETPASAPRANEHCCITRDPKGDRGSASVTILPG